MNSNYILWLCSWYPSVVKPYDGDFIQRHAQAVALYKKVYVLAIINDEKGVTTKTQTDTITTTGNLTEHIIIYHKPITGFLSKFLALNSFMRIGEKAIKTIVNDNGKPLLIHNHVVMHAGLLALKAAHWYKIPFIVSEHWTGYLPEAKPNFKGFNFLSKLLWKKVIKKAMAITAVSNYLITHLATLSGRNDIQRVANVVNTDIFKPIEQPLSATTKFIHISTLSWQKNIDVILKAVEIIADSEKDFILKIVCPNPSMIINKPMFNNIKNHLQLLTEIPQQKLAEEIAESNALILYSRYETFGCVIIEAHACGVPTIVNNIAVLKEIVDTNNGIVTNENTPESLAQSMLQLIEGRTQFNKSTIRNTVVNQYTFHVIGKHFIDLYDNVTHI